MAHVGKAENPTTNPSKSGLVGGECPWRMTKGSRVVADLHISLVTLNSTAGSFGFVLPKKRDNYTCCRDDYKTKIPTKPPKMAKVNR